LNVQQANVQTLISNTDYIIYC